MIRFRIRTLFIALTVVCLLVAAITQAGMTDARFQFLDSKLAHNVDGTVNGQIRWNFFESELDSSQTPMREFVCHVNGVKLSDATVKHLRTLRPGTLAKVRYRDRTIGPLKKQDPFGRYIHNELRIDSNKVVGYAWYDGWTEVVISGP